MQDLFLRNYWPHIFNDAYVAKVLVKKPTVFNYINFTSLLEPSKIHMQ